MLNMQFTKTQLEYDTESWKIKRWKRYAMPKEN